LLLPQSGGFDMRGAETEPENKIRDSSRRLLQREGEGVRRDFVTGPVRTPAKTVNLFDTNFLLASLLWGSIGVGYFIYGKKQRAMMPMIGGVVMVLASYFVSSWLLMSLICIALMVAVYLLAKQGY
jgi:hypothetical protein